MNVTISHRGKTAPPSPIRKLAPLADGARKRGIEVLQVNIGQPDIPAPPQFLEGVRAFNQKLVGYEPSSGRADLCEAWARSTSALIAAEVQPSEVVITTGASEALLFAFCIIADSGDEILAFDPCYANYIGIGYQAGITVKAIPLSFEQNFALPDMQTIEAAITPRTKAFIICSPNNPTGTVCPAEKLAELIDLCERRSLFLISDESYREYVFDGRKPCSVLALRTKSQCTIVVDSVSKRLALCGARIGALVSANADVTAAALRLGQARLSSPSVEQAAIVYVLNNLSPTFIDGIRKEYEIRRNALCQALDTIPGVSYVKPQGAFYLMARLPVADSDAFCKFLLEKFSHNQQTVFFAPAGGFYANAGQGSDQVRIAAVLESSRLVRVAELLKLGLENFTK